MGKKLILLLFSTVLLLTTIASSTFATSYLYDWAFNINGTTYENFLGDIMPTTGSLDSAGLGTLNWSTNIAGSYNFIAFFDHEIDESINTFFNEYGSAIGSPAVGQSWEIDEPGYIFGDIYDNVVQFGSLDNSNAVPTVSPDDVSMAMGWNFTLSANELAMVGLTISHLVPASGFYLSQTDPDSAETIYFSSSLNISGGGTSVPDAGIMLLLSTALGGLGVLEIKKLFINKTA